MYKIIMRVKNRDCMGKINMKKENKDGTINCTVDVHKHVEYVLCLYIIAFD